MVTFLRKELLPELKRLHVLGDIPAYLWGDNQGVLYWIKDSAHVYGKFVQNRLSEIRLTPDVTFRSHTLWWHGAPWLTEDETQWPEQPSDFQPFSEDQLGADAKVKAPEEVEVHVTTRLESRKASPPLLTALNGAIPADRRSYARIRRVLTMVVRFVGNCVERRWKRVLTLPLMRPFSPSHTIHAPEAFRHLIQYQATELLLVWEAQQYFPPTQAQASQFNVETFPDGLLRCRGCLERGPLAFDTVNPIWLPEKTRVATHVVLATHVVNAHAPVETTLALIRRRFWLIKGRRNIRQIIAKSCKGCQLVRGPAFRIPDYAQLPLERVSQSRPFAHIGLDLFGPFQVRMGTNQQADPSHTATKRRGRKATTRPSDGQPSDLVKVWGVIFTCMATRAVHLEVTHSQSAEHLMHAMDRFMCCRGHPCSVTSDNAPSIILVNRALAAMWKSTMADPVMQVYARSHGIEWHFITPESPWQGGFYERLIRSVKHCLTASIGRRRLEFSDFTRLLARVAHTLNCRPLTYQSEGDVNAVALRPLDFLQPLAEDTTNMGPAAEDMSDPDYTHKLSSDERLIKLYAKQNALLEAFWERWRQEYLLSLRERQRQPKNANRLDRDPQVGEYVLVDDDEPIPRPFWKLARIIQLVPGRDGVVRFVK
ncbi:Integrase core domain containing protein, partial [Aphelenchoides avenae]